MSSCVARSCVRLSVLAVGVVAVAARGEEAGAPADAPVVGSLSGRVLGADKAPVAGARVRLLLDEPDAKPRAYKELRSIETGEAGAYEFRDLPKGWYLLVVQKEGLARTFRYFVLDESLDLSQEFVLREPVRSTVVVRDEAGKPIAGARVRTLNPRDENGEFWVRSRKDWETFGQTASPSDETGRLTLPELPAGAVVTAVIDHPDFAPAEVKEAAVGPEVAAEVTLKPGVAVSLKVAAGADSPGPAEAEIQLLHDAVSHPSTILYDRRPLDAEGTARLTVEPGRYSLLWLKHEDYHFTPIYSSRITDGEYIRLGSSANEEFHFTPLRKVKVRGRVTDASGRPLAKVLVKADLPNVGPDGRVPAGDDEWAHADWGETDAEGRYIVDLAAGRVRISFEGEGFVSDEPYTEFEVASDGSTESPELRVRSMPKVAGTVVDREGRPVPGVVVRFRGNLRHHQPVLTDEQGRFELAPSWFPVDRETEERRPAQPLVAFHPHEGLGARTTVNLDKPESLGEVTLTLGPQEPEAALEGYRDEATPAERGEAGQERLAELAEKALIGQAAPELDGTWLNMEKPAEGLAAFRGKYVLLDFWFIGCGPCHADFPSVKLLHDLYKDRGLVVIAVHDNSATAETVREFAEKEGMMTPIVVDEPDGRTLARYEGRGVSGFPSHLLIGPDGTVIDDDRTTPGPSLRAYKVEVVRALLLGR